jgi:hypothetical protein
LFGEIDLDTHWSHASLHSTGMAPDPLDTPEAVVQVYAARLLLHGVRGPNTLRRAVYARFTP